jgi:hypothetical protein
VSDATNVADGHVAPTAGRGRTLVDVDILDESPVPVSGADEQRVVDLGDDYDTPVLPDQTPDDTDRGWGEWAGSNDDRLLDDRPPHW